VTYEASRRAERTWMYALENEMFVRWDALGPVLCRCAPGEKDDTSGAYFRHGVNYLLREQLPALAGMRVRIPFSDSEAGVQKQNTTVCPWCEETTLVWRGFVVWVVDLERFIYILEGWRSRGRWADREAKPVCLVRTVVRVLASDDHLDGIQWCVSRPIARVSCCVE
jgi:hypothetical protein